MKVDLDIRHAFIASLCLLVPPTSLAADVDSYCAKIGDIDFAIPRTYLSRKPLTKDSKTLTVVLNAVLPELRTVTPDDIERHHVYSAIPGRTLIWLQEEFKEPTDRIRFERMAEYLEEPSGIPYAHDLTRYSPRSNQARYMGLQIFTHHFEGDRIATALCDESPILHCSISSILYPNVLVTYQFDRTALPDWKSIDSKVRALIASFRANPCTPNKWRSAFRFFDDEDEYSTVECRTDVVRLKVGGSDLSIPCKYVEPPIRQREGQARYVIMQAVLPDIRPITNADIAQHKLPGAIPGWTRFWISENLKGPTDEQRFEIWMKYVEDRQGIPTSFGLIQYRQRTYSPYEKSEMFAHRFEDGRILMIRCRDSSGPCRMYVAAFPGTLLEINFAREYVEQWRAIDDGMQKLIKSFRIAANPAR